MLALLWVPLALARTVENPPYGWACRVAEKLAPAVEMSLWQGVAEPANTRDARQLWVETRTGGASQLLVWDLAPADAVLPDPAALTLYLDLKRVDDKGRIRIVYDKGEATELPASAGRVHLEREQATVRIDDQAAMRALWHANHWRLTIRDRTGRVLGTAERASPPRAQIEAGFARLSRQLQAAAASPAHSTSCWELDDGAVI